MREDDFISKNMGNWKLLESYNAKLSKIKKERAEKGEIREFLSLYRAAAHNLAYARTHYKDGKTAAYLNRLVSASHPHIFVKEKTGFKPVLSYFKKGFPEAVGKQSNLIFAAFAFFMAAYAFCAVMTLLYPSFAGYFFAADSIGSSSDNSGEVIANGLSGFFSAFIMTNNIRVCAMNIALGITGGLGTVYVLLVNGGMLGSLWAHFYSGGTSFMMPEFWSLILPHGFIELYAIFITGGFGLLIGKRMLIPKELTRRHSLIKGFKEAAFILPGAAAMLVIAGLIEGFFTPLDISPYFKLIFSAFTLIGLILYFGPWVFGSLFKKKKSKKT